MKIAVTIEGISPLLFCRFTDEAQEKASRGSGASQVGERKAPADQARDFLYADEAGEPIMPSPMLLACITAGGSFFKAGKSKVTTQKSSLIPACVFLTDVYYPLKSNAGWKIDTRPVRIPATGGRILCHRPCFDDWRVDFEIELDTEIMSGKLLREIVDAAGKRCGIGAFRPSCKGPFGRFVVTHWEQSEA
jgi:hypothetical protein